MKNFDSDLEDLVHDVRLVKHHIRRETLSRDDHKQYLEGLPDSEEQGEETITRFARVWNATTDA